MAAVKLKNKGFGMAEFLAAAGLTAMAAAFLVPAYGGVQKYLLKMQAERAANALPVILQLCSSILFTI